MMMDNIIVDEFEDRSGWIILTNDNNGFKKLWGHWR